MDDLFLSALDRQQAAVGYALGQALRRTYPDKALLEGVCPAFNIGAYAAAGMCGLAERTVPYGQRITHWRSADVEPVERPHNTFFDVTWEGEKLRVVVAHYHDGTTGPYHYFILADTHEVAARFHDAVCTWNTPIPDDYILVFDINGWNRDDALLAAIANARLDNLVLRGEMKREIVDDLASFFAGREMYAEYGVPWKRGVLFLGPPGNGKTHAVKALVNHLGLRCLYVKTFTGHGPEQMSIRLVFERARSLAPCLLVLEDLDSLITPQNRSYFLNELDGFEGNDGILTLATTNHPERLDPAILNRPSRFDRAYSFDLPGTAERLHYIDAWNRSLKPALQLPEGAAGELAEATDGFSFAYLKELFLSATMRWMTGAQPGTMGEVMAEQVATLREQIATVEEIPSDPGYGLPMIRRGPQHRGPHVRPADDVPL